MCASTATSPTKSSVEVFPPELTPERSADPTDGVLDRLDILEGHIEQGRPAALDGDARAADFGNGAVVSVGEASDGELHVEFERGVHEVSRRLAEVGQLLGEFLFEPGGAAVALGGELLAKLAHDALVVLDGEGGVVREGSAGAGGVVRERQRLD